MTDHEPQREVAHRDAPRCSLPDLGEENAKLRALVIDLERENLGLRERSAATTERLQALLEARRDLAVRLVECEAQRRRMGERLAAMAQENEGLQSRVQAAHRLHATLDREAVITTIHEILTDLVGCEAFALLDLTPNGRAFSLVSWRGVDAETIYGISVDEGVVGEVVRSGESFVGEEIPRCLGLRGELPITACVALALDGRLSGVLVLFRMREPKARLEPADRDLLDLLGTHVAPALLATRSYAVDTPTDRPPACAQ